MKYSDILELSKEEIVNRVNEEKRNLNKMRLTHAVSPLENPNKISETRKTIARLLTALTIKG